MPWLELPDVGPRSSSLHHQENSVDWSVLTGIPVDVSQITGVEVAALKERFDASSVEVFDCFNSDCSLCFDHGITLAHSRVIAQLQAATLPECLAR